MIGNEQSGDIFESTAQSLVVPVNIVGVAGKGLAKAFALRFPTWLRSYQTACRNRSFSLRSIHTHTLDDDRKVVSLPTKLHWRHPSKIEWLDWSLRYLAENYDKHGIESIAIPAVGCGEGGLEWEHVRALVYRYLDPIELPVEIWLPSSL